MGQNERVEIPINVSFSEEGGSNITFSDDTPFNASFGPVEKISTSNYEELFNKPILNGNTIIGDKVSADYHLQDRMDEITPQDIDKLFYGG